MKFTKALIACVLLCTLVTSSLRAGLAQGVSDTKLFLICEDAISIGRAGEDGRYSDKEMLDFSIVWNMMRYPKRFTKISGHKVSLQGKYVSEACRATFGRAPRLTSVRNWRYSQGVYVGSGPVFKQLNVLLVNGMQLSKNGALIQGIISHEDEKEGIQRWSVVLRMVGSGKQKRYFLVQSKKFKYPA